MIKSKIPGASSTLFASCAVFVAWAAAPASAQSFTKYVLTDLGTLGGERSEARGINDAGNIVGWSTTQPGSSVLSRRAFLWLNGSMIDLGTLDGPTSMATAINNADTIVGRSSVGITSSPQQAFIWHDGVMSPIPGIAGQQSSAIDINDLNMIVGSSSTGVWVWDDGKVIEVPEPYGNSYIALWAINNSGQAVGHIEHMDSHTGPAVMWQEGEVAELGTPGSMGFAMGTAVNSAGVVIGEAGWDIFFIGELSVGWRWEDGVFTMLPSESPKQIGMTPRAINEDGLIVGTMWNWDYEHSAFITDGSELVKLDSLIAADSGWFIVDAFDVNAGGQIVGVAIPPDATQWWEHRAVLLAPAAPGDLNLNGSVGVEDLLILLSAWGQCADCPPAPGDCPADLDGDCAVGVSDLLILLANWG